MIYIPIALAIMTVTFLSWGFTRNARIYNCRMKLLNNNMEVYSKLPTYQKMMWSFKPLKKFVNEAQAKTKKYSNGVGN